MGAPPLTRTFKVGYGSLSIETSTGYTLLGGPSVRIDEDSFSIAFDVLISESSTSAAEAKWAALEAALGLDEQDVTLTLGGFERTFSQDANTAFNIVARCNCNDSSPRNSAYSREYHCEVEGDIPFDRTGEDAGYQGLRTLGFTVEKTQENRRTVSIAGSYTAQPDTGSGVVSARAQYDDQLQDLEDAILDLVDDMVDWDIIGSQVEEEKRGKVIAFRRLHVEGLTAKLAGGAGDLDVIDPFIQTVANYVAPSTSSRGIRSPVDVTVVYRCGVDAERTKDLQTVFTSKVRPRMIEAAQASIGNTSTGFAVLAVNPGLDLSSNRINAQMVVRLFEPGNILATFDSTQDQIDKGLEVVPVHDGNPASGLVFQRFLGASRSRAVGVMVLGDEAAAVAALDALAPEKPYTAATIGAGSPTQSGGPIDLESVPKFGVSGGGFLEVSRSEAKTKRIVGLVNEDVEITQATRTIVSQYVAKPQIRDATSAFTGS